jgi:hypothetical protein
VNEVELALFKSRKSLLEVCSELGYNISDVEIELKQCSCCDIWLKNLKKDLDGLDICVYCLDAYGA